MKAPILMFVMLISFACMHTYAAFNTYEFNDRIKKERFDKLINELRCTVCQNQTIADSNAALAVDLRREIRGMVEAGQTEQEIKIFLTDRYGEFVLYRPRWSAATAVLWLAPVVLVLLGAAWLWRIVQRRAAMPVSTEEEDALDA